MGWCLDESDEDIVGRRLGQLAGLLALILVLSRAGRLVQFGEGLPPWHLILISATLLGAIVWWLISQTTLSTVAGAYLFVLGSIIVFLRVAVPETLMAGIIPTEDTLPVLGERMDIAFRLIRGGVAPVFPEPGLIAILAFLMWALGGLYTHGALSGRVNLMIIPVGIVYLQFAVFDRRQAGLSWMMASAATIGLALTAVALGRSQNVGRARDEAGLPKPHRSPVAALVMAGIIGVASIATATNAMGMVSEYGNLPWRSLGGGFGSGPGGIAFDRFVDLRQRLISRENALLFRATLGPDSPPPGQIYWRMETLDQFDGIYWRRSNTQTRVYSPGSVIGNPNHPYQGNTATVLQRVFISRLAGEVLPTAGEATTIHQIAGDGVINPQSIRYGRDSTLFYPVGIRPDDNYQVESLYPLVDLDLGALATGRDGQLSPIFSAAAEAGVFTASPSPGNGHVLSPDEYDQFTQLPANTPAALRGIAVTRTRGATTNFERAWMLQHWFRDSNDFTYSQEVTTGHGALVLLDWLNEPNSLNYRTGYCEQFAASMAVLGRLLGIPSRVVWGFTPGAAVTIDGIEVIEVRDTNAHAWVEMWMDGFGWVRFDPTPRGGVLPTSMTAGWNPGEFVPENPITGVVDLPDDPQLTPLDPGFLDQPPIGLPGAGPRLWPLWILVMAALGSVVPLVKRLRRKRRIRSLQDGDVTAAWDEIIDRLTDLGEPISEHLTPLEFARFTGTALLPLANDYSAAIYGGKRGALGESDLVEVEWWLQNRYEMGQRFKGALNPRSLIKRR